MSARFGPAIDRGKACYRKGSRLAYLGDIAALRWVFLDVGNILLDEDPLTFFVFRRHVEAIQRSQPGRSFGDLLAEREACALAGSAWPVHDVVCRYLDDEARSALWRQVDAEVRTRFGELSPPVAGARELVAQLASQFRLGLIANQGEECAQRLATLGFLDRIDLVVLSEREQLFKPDERLYQVALERAGALAHECLMVGDRLDYDVGPAQRVGMSTAWVRWPCRAAKGGMPAEPAAALYLRALERTAVEAERRLGGIRPAIAVDTVADLLRTAWASAGAPGRLPLADGSDRPYD